MTAKAHAFLSASSSDRWLHCPPSARLCEAYEDKESSSALYQAYRNPSSSTAILLLFAEPPN